MFQLSPFLAHLLVYSVSKWKASSATTVGWNGGETDFLTNWSQSMEEKKVWALISSIPFGPDPSLFVGFRLKRARRRDCASGLRNVGMPSFAWTKIRIKFWLIYSYDWALSDIMSMIKGQGLGGNPDDLVHYLFPVSSLEWLVGWLIVETCLIDNVSYLTDLIDWIP